MMRAVWCLSDTGTVVIILFSSMAIYFREAGKFREARKRTNANPLHTN